MEYINCPQCNKLYDEDEHEYCPHCSYGYWDDDNDEEEKLQDQHPELFCWNCYEQFGDPEFCENCGVRQGGYGDAEDEEDDIDHLYDEDEYEDEEIL